MFAILGRDVLLSLVLMLRSTATMCGIMIIASVTLPLDSKGSTTTPSCDGVFDMRRLFAGVGVPAVHWLLGVLCCVRLAQEGCPRDACCLLFTNSIVLQC